MIEYNSDYELIRKPKPHRSKTQTNRVARRLGLGIFDAMYLLSMLPATIIAMIVVKSVMLFMLTAAFVAMMVFASVVGDPTIVLNFLYIVTVGYALWRARLIQGLLPKIIWGVLIITVIGAVVFLLIDPVPKGNRTVSKKKWVMG